MKKGELKDLLMVILTIFVLVETVIVLDISSPVRNTDLIKKELKIRCEETNPAVNWYLYNINHKDDEIWEQKSVHCKLKDDLSCVCDIWRNHCTQIGCGGIEIIGQITRWD